MRGGAGPSESDGVLVEAPPSVDIPPPFISSNSSSAIEDLSMLT